MFGSVTSPNEPESILHCLNHAKSKVLTYFDHSIRTFDGFKCPVMVKSLGFHGEIREISDFADFPEILVANGARAIILEPSRGNHQCYSLLIYLVISCWWPWQEINPHYGTVTLGFFFGKSSTVHVHVWWFLVTCLWNITEIWLEVNRIYKWDMASIAMSVYWMVSPGAQLWGGSLPTISNILGSHHSDSSSSISRSFKQHLTIKLYHIISPFLWWSNFIPGFL